MELALTGDLDVATQGNGLAGFEHIETKVCKSDGDTNFQTDLLEYTYDGAVIDLRSVRHLYSQYLIYYHLTPDYGSNDCNLLFDLMNYSSSMNVEITKRSMVWWKRITT